MSTESGAGDVAVRPVIDTGDEYAAFKIEQRGIDLIPRGREENEADGALLALGWRRLQRGVPVLRHADHDLRAVGAAGHPGHPDRQPHLRVPRLGQPAGAEDRDHRVHGLPGAVREEREPPGRPVQLADAGRVRDRGRLLRRRHRAAAVRARPHHAERVRQGRDHHRRRRGPDGPAAARARHDQQDLPVHGVHLHRVLRGAGDLHLPAAAPVHLPRAPGVARRLDHRAGHAHLGRRPRLDRERERLLAVPAPHHARAQDVLGGGARRRDPLDPARDPRRARLHGHHQDGRPGRAAASRRRSPAGSWCRS